VWDDAAEDEARIADVRRAWSAVAPHAMAASYVNNLGDEGQERVRDAYGPAKYARLQALKDRHDPHNVFHRNQNVRPTTAVGSSGS
jgi:FAD/FMN-containing dehydrogenase